MSNPELLTLAEAAKVANIPLTIFRRNAEACKVVRDLGPGRGCGYRIARSDIPTVTRAVIAASTPSDTRTQKACETLDRLAKGTKA